VLGYPAPARRVRVANWPENRDPVHLDAWWIDDQNPDFGRTLPWDLTKPTPAGFTGAKTQVDNIDITIDNVRVESRLVQPADGAKPVQKDCLVVRVTHPKDQRVMVKIDLDHQGEEHQYYAKVNKYTAIFWNVTEDQAKEKPITLKFLSVDTFKHKNKVPAHHVQLKNVPPPHPNDAPPRAVPPD
jgi:hypothetical protein